MRLIHDFHARFESSWGGASQGWSRHRQNNPPRLASAGRLRALDFPFRGQPGCFACCPKGAIVLCEMDTCSRLVGYVGCQQMEERLRERPLSLIHI